MSASCVGHKLCCMTMVAALGAGCGGSERTPASMPGTGGSGAASGSAADDGSGAAAGGSAAAEGSAAAGGAAAGGAGAMDTAGSAASGGPTSETPGVRFIGRVDDSDPAAVRFAWSGSGVVARFTGTSLGVRIGGGQQFTVVLDGVVQPKLIPTGGVDSVASGLAPGNHEVELYRRTEANQGPSTFFGFELGKGQLLPPPPPSDRRIEIIGDSISCGYGNEGADETCTFSQDTENHYLTYGALAARELGAELVTVAWSGKGVVCNYGDDAASCTDPMPVYYDRTLPDLPSSLWDFSAWQPHAVIINLGTNDFSTAMDPAAADFESAYVALLARVREVYPEALILCTVGPLLNGADLSSARTSISNAVAARVAAGDAAVETFDLAPQDAANGLGCDYHPSLRTHEIMADVLTGVLQAKLGW